LGRVQFQSPSSDDDSNTNHQLVDLLSEGSSSTTDIAEMSLAAGVGNSSELVSSPSISRIGSNDVSVSDVAGSSIIGGGGGWSSSMKESTIFMTTLLD